MGKADRLLAVLFVTVVLMGCGGGVQTGTLPAEQTSPAQPGFAIVPPGAALSTIVGRTSSTITLERQGSAHATGLVQRTTVEDTSARFNPSWTTGSASFDNLSYAIYNFNLQGYSGQAALSLDWGEAPLDNANLWIGLSHWGLDHWKWFPGPASDTLEVGGNGYEDYIAVATGDMLVAVVMLGMDTPLLNTLSVGESTPGGWPMFGSDLQHTRRSPYIGPQTNNAKWIFATGNQVPSSPAVGADGTVYVGSFDGNFYAINPDGSQKWAFPSGALVHSSPAIGTDGTVYVGSYTGDKKLYAFNPDGTVKWAFTAANSVVSSPAIGADGTVYVGCVGAQFYAINPDGSQKWSYPAVGIAESSPAIGMDGTIFIGGTKLHAINPDGTAKWIFEGNGVFRASPAIGADGTIYIGTPNNFFYAVHSDGSLNWEFATEGTGMMISSPAIGADGTLYIGSNDGNVYAIQDAQ